MTWLETLAILLGFSAAFTAAALALLAWQRRDEAHWIPTLMIAMLGLATWSFAYAMGLEAPGAGAKVFWATVQYFGIVTAPLAWFLFVVQFTGRDTSLRRKYWMLLLPIPVTTLALVLTNNWHHLVWSHVSVVTSANGFSVLSISRGPWFWVHTVYSYLLLAASTLFLIHAYRASRDRQPGHLIALLSVTLIPWFANAVYLVSLSPVAWLDLTPVGLSVATAILAWSVFEQDLFGLVPIARQTVLDSLHEGIIVVGSQGRIADVNPAAEEILGAPAADLLGCQLAEVMKEWASLWAEVIGGADDFEREVAKANSGGTRVFSAHVSTVGGRAGFASGRLIVLRDITQRKSAEQEMIARRQLFENLVAVARATAEGGPSLEDTLQNALDVAAALTKAEYGSLFLLDANGRVTHSILARGQTGNASRQRIIGKVMGAGLAGWAVREKQSARVGDTAQDARWLTLPDQPYQVRSVLVVPITSGGDVPGVLTLQHSQCDHFSEADEILLRSASDQMALALRNAQIYDGQRRLAKRQAILYEVLRTIGGKLEPETVVQVAVETISHLTGWPAVAILVPVANEGALLVEAGSGLISASTKERQVLMNGPARKAFTSGTTQYIADRADGRRESDAAARLRSGIFVPLRRGEKLGVFAVQSDEAHAFGDDDLWLAESLAEAIALAISNARLFGAVAAEHGRLQALIGSSRDGIMLVGVDKRILVLNQTALKILGLPGAPDDWIYRPVLDVLHLLRRRTPALVHPIIAEIRRLAQDGELSGDGELAIGAYFVRWTLIPVETGDELLGYLVALQDMTRERMLQDMRDDLTHAMVHDLRNPLNIVSGVLAMLRELPGLVPESEEEQMLEIARHSTARMLELVNGILGISQLESGRMPLNPNTFDINKMVADVIEAQRPLAREKQLTLDTDGNSANVGIEADQNLLERVLENLVGNAIKFTPQGGVVSVTVEPFAASVEVAVSDTGPGVPVEIRDQLFNKFVRGGQAERGSGLGLAFCRMAVEAHGGNIWLDTAETQGATFRFTLPLHGKNGSRAPRQMTEFAQPST